MDAQASRLVSRRSATAELLAEYEVALTLTLNLTLTLTLTLTPTLYLPYISLPGGERAGGPPGARGVSAAGRAHRGARGPRVAGGGTGLR